MPTINVNGVPVDYPDVGDSNWGTDATNFAIYVAAALGKIGQSDPPQTNDITISPGNLSVGGTTTLTGNLTSNGNNNLGNASGDTTAVTGILNVNSGVLYVDPSTNKVGINDTTPSEALDVTGNALISGTLGVTGNSTFTGDVITSIVKASGSGGLTIDSNGGTDVALFGAGGGSGTTLYGGLNGTTATFSGVIYADDDTTANTPVISFTGDTNTGIGRSAADTIDLITNGNSRFRIESTGQIQAVVSGGTTFLPGYLCRAWVNFNGTLSGTISFRGSGNISSVVKTSTGTYTINIDTDLPNGNYSVVTSASYVSGVGQASAGILNGSTPTGASFVLQNVVQTVLTDSDFICVGIFI